MLRVSEQFARSDTGRQRPANEDAFLVRDPLFAVADGMGGAQAGEVASSTAVAVFEQDLPNGSNDEERLSARTLVANKQIFDLSQQSEQLAGMGTTLTVALAGPDSVTVAHVGDSRTYVLRDDQLTQVTQDHSLVDELVRSGKLTAEEAATHPQRSVITRALGPEPSVEVDTYTYPARAEDIYLMCTDGLTGMVTDTRICDVLRSSNRLSEAGRRLIDEANLNGGVDNITVVLFRLEAVPNVSVSAANAMQPDDQPTAVGELHTSDVQRALAAQGRGGPEGALAATAMKWPGAVADQLPDSPGSGSGGSPSSVQKRGSGRKSRLARRLAKVTLLLAAATAIVLAGAWVAIRSVYFVGTGSGGMMTMYRGVPYELPAGLKLYQAAYVSPVGATQLSPPRRVQILNHKLRSYDDARDLMHKLELGEVE